MTNFKIENPWNIQSIYDLQYFRCPSCEYCDNSKQQFVNHAYESHPNCIDYLLNIKDGSFDDILCPWESVDIKLEKHLSMELTEDSYEDQHNESFDSEFPEHIEESDIKDIKPEENFTMELTEESLKTDNKFKIKTNHKNGKDKTKGSEKPKKIRKKVKCDVCNQIYASQWVLDRHKEEFHDGYKCKLWYGSCA